MRWSPITLLLGAAPLWAACGAGGGGSEDDASSGSPTDADTTATGTGSGGATTMGDCSLPTYDDDIVLGSGVALPGSVRRLVVVDGNTVGCGDGFVAGAASITVSGACRGLATLDTDRIVAATASGQLVLASVDASSLSELDRFEDPGQGFHGAAIEAARVLVAAGTDGVLAHDLGGDVIGPQVAIPGATDARDVVPIADGILVADGHDGVRVLDGQGGGVLDEIPVDGEVIRVVAQDDRALALLGPRGLVLLDVAGGALSEELSATTEGTAVDAVLIDDGALVVAGSSLLRYRFADGAATLISREGRPAVGELDGPWFRAAATDGTAISVSVGPDVLPIELGAGAAAPHVRVDRATLSFWADPGELTDVLALFKNGGEQDLVLADADAGPISAEPTAVQMERPGCPGQVVVAPGDVALVELKYEPEDDSLLETELTVATDDPDWPTYAQRLEANRPSPAVGDMVPDAAMLLADGGLFTLSDLLGDVVLLKLFNHT